MPGLELPKRKTLPVAETQFHQTRFCPVSERVEPHCCPHQFHRFARSPHRAGDKVEILTLADQRGQAAAVASRLLASKFIDVGIGLTLQATLSVPLRLAVARDVDERIHQVFRRIRADGRRQGALVEEAIP